MLNLRPTKLKLMPERSLSNVHNFPVWHMYLDSTLALYVPGAHFKQPSCLQKSTKKLKMWYSIDHEKSFIYSLKEETVREFPCSTSVPGNTSFPPFSS
jgi:hypothetical protein